MMEKKFFPEQQPSLQGFRSNSEGAAAAVDSTYKGAGV